MHICIVSSPPQQRGVIGTRPNQTEWTSALCYRTEEEEEEEEAEEEEEEEENK